MYVIVIGNFFPSDLLSLLPLSSRGLSKAVDDELPFLVPDAKRGVFDNFANFLAVVLLVIGIAV